MQSTTLGCIFLDMTTGTRIAAAREAKKLNQSELARMLGVSPQSVQAWESDKNTPRPNRLKEIASALGVTASYLMGEGERPPASLSSVVKGNFPVRRSGPDDIEIPQYDVRASMGSGQVLPSDYIDTIRNITVAPSFLPDQGVSYTKAENLAVITGFGESMNKTFCSGDPLIIDRGITTVVTDGIYLFSMSDTIFVKRLQRIPNGIRVISDNDLYPPYDLIGEDAGQIIIHARVLLAWRSQKL